MAGMRPICPQIVQDEDLRLDQHPKDPGFVEG